MEQIDSSYSNIANMIKQLSNSIDEASVHVTEQEDLLKIYFSKGKAGRKSMFYERNLHGWSTSKLTKGKKEIK